MADPIPDVVRRLILERIDSVPELEAILLLREYPGRDWTAAEASQRLYVSQTVGAHILATLAQRGFLVSREQRYRYEPGSPDLAQTIDALAETYAHHLVAVTQLIHAKPSASVREFAEAFRLRKDK